MSKIITSKKNEAGQLTTIIVQPITKEMGMLKVSNSTNGKSALRAAATLHRHGDYSLALSEVGFHIYSKHTEMKPYMERYAIVSMNYAGDKISTETLNIEAANHPLGWAQVNWFNGHASLTTIHPWGDPEVMEEEERKAYLRNMQKARQRAMKHDWVDVMLQGYGLEIDCFFWPEYASTILEGIEMKDDGAAREHRIEGYNRKETRVKLFGKTNEILKEVGVSTVVSQVEVTLTSGETKLVSELDFGRYTPFYGSKPRGTIRWDGSSVALNALLNAADMDLRLKLEREL